MVRLQEKRLLLMEIIEEKAKARTAAVTAMALARRKPTECPRCHQVQPTYREAVKHCRRPTAGRPPKPRQEAASLRVSLRKALRVFLRQCSQSSGANRQFSLETRWTWTLPL